MGNPHRMKHNPRKKKDSVRFAVSPEMVAFRAEQTLLNRFLWSTELCYFHVWSRADRDFPDHSIPAHVSLGHVESNAWFPNNQGQWKMIRSTGQFLKLTREDTTRFYRMVLMNLYSFFENHLERRARAVKVGGDRWGPFVASLSSPALRNGIAPLPLATVLHADLYRLVRNGIIHRPNQPLPVSEGDQRVRDWRRNLLSDARNAHWPASDADGDEAVHHVVGHVKEAIERAGKRGKTIPAEFFYLLFAFTDFDRLACQIEEALLPRGVPPAGWILRPKEWIRRPDLVIQKP
jgi:hypothetical protein